MTTYPNARYLSLNPSRYFGPSAGTEVLYRGLSDRLNVFTNENILKTASVPDGYDVRAYVPALTSGSMTTLTSIATITEYANLLKGGPISATVEITSLTGDNRPLSLITSLSSTAPILTLSGDNLVLKLAMSLIGNGALTLTGLSALSITIPLAGLGSWSLTGVSDLRGLLSLRGEWTPYTELSPENLAKAVWNAIESEFNNPNTMGQLLHAAGAAGDPWVTSLPGSYTSNQAGRLLYNLIAYVRNKKRLVKEGGTWYLIIRNDNDTDDLLKKPLKDKNGNDITDIDAGVLAQELGSVV